MKKARYHGVFLFFTLMNITVLTGAGISAESGISTFRDNGGLWDKYNVYEVATPEAWINNQELVLQFYNERREQLLNCKPNNAHFEIAKWENHFNVNVITQNVDDLHERGGSKNVLHLHGELLKSRSTGPTNKVYEMTSAFLNMGDICPEGYQLRPHIVWFGEDVPMFPKAEEIAVDADILIVIGTSLQVYPAASLAFLAKPSTPIYVIDPSDMDSLPNNAIHIKEKASIGTKKLTDILLREYLE
jgi:NAD-dependent deacetylase